MKSTHDETWLQQLLVDLRWMRSCTCSTLNNAAHGPRCHLLLAERCVRLIEDNVEPSEKERIMYREAPNIPGQAHRWANEIKAWAEGKLIQYRYAGVENDWLDCAYNTRGEPNWFNELLEFRIHE